MVRREVFEIRPGFFLESVGACAEGAVGVVVGAGPGGGVVQGVVAGHVAGEECDGVGGVMGEEVGGG